MPLYEYKCDKCGKVFEVIQRFSDEPLKVHEACGGGVERLISRSAIQFKGSGFYINDYAKGGSSPSAESSGKAEAKADAKSDAAKTKTDGKSESKTETKSESKTESKSDSKPATPASTSKE
jgi:putative FmdB family regulatory protein